jgi:diaminopimelate epimerase
MSKTLDFLKMNGAGNDFVMIDNRSGANALSRDEIARLCDRHRGVGADGLLLLETGQGSLRMRYYNADGGEAEMCGNGARCFARFAQIVGAAGETLSFSTVAGTVSARIEGAAVTIGMSEPHDLATGRTLEIAGQPLTVHSLNTGVPHAVVFVGDVAAVDVAGAGRAIRYHQQFAPKGTNANFCEIAGPGALRIRTYERGVEAETLACGTGVVAAALLHHRLAGVPSPVAVTVRGGETLRVGFDAGADGFRNVTLTGPAEVTFEGRVGV